MKRELDALQELARVALTGPASEEGLRAAADILRQAAGAMKAAIDCAQDQDFLIRSAGPPPSLRGRSMSLDS